MGSEWDSDAPPPMPLSALLYSPAWMRLVYHQAPWLVYPMMRHARRDALTCYQWLSFCIFQYYASVRWLELNARPIRVVPM